MLASEYVDGAGRWGLQDASKWNAYSSWLVAQGVVTDTNDKVVSGVLPGGALFTNELLERRTTQAP